MRLDTRPATMNDFVRIRRGEGRFRPEDSVEIHESSREWLVGQLEQAFDGLTVIVTHHLPASMSIATRYAGNLLNRHSRAGWRA